MAAEIRSLDSVDHAPGLKALVRAYLSHELQQLKEVSGLALDLDTLLANTFDKVDSYLPPEGRLLVATERDGNEVGCVFLKMIRPDAAEIKRLYVVPGARGLGLGRRLMDDLLDQARTLGAKSILLDTGVYDVAAQALYRKLGFYEIDYYPEGENDPELTPYLVYMQLDLE